MKTNWENLQDAMAREAEWGTDNVGNVRINGIETDIDPHNFTNESDFTKAIQDALNEDALAETMGRGITRQGGNN